MNVAIFVDGGYFEKVKACSGVSRINFSAIPRALVDLTREQLVVKSSRWYDCPPLIPNPRLDIIERNGWQLRKGILKAEGCSHCGRGLRQKQVDVLLALDLVLGTIDKEFEAAILVTNDGDFIPSIQQAGKRGLEKIWVAMRPNDRDNHDDLVREAPTILLEKEWFESLAYASRPVRIGESWDAEGRGSRP
jgi:uncharacterized LabA/DUF88 family protein